jgi:hypothetical protein
MKLRMDATLRFWVDVAYDDIKLDHIVLTKQQLLAQISPVSSTSSAPHLVTAAAESENVGRKTVSTYGL